MYFRKSFGADDFDPNAAGAADEYVAPAGGAAVQAASAGAGPAIMLAGGVALKPVRANPRRRRRVRCLRRARR